MGDESDFPSDLARAYQKSAAWFDRVAELTFKIAERVIIVGGLKFAVATLPPKSENRILLSNVTGILELILIYWVITKLWSNNANDYSVLHHAKIENKKYLFLYRAISLVIVLVGTYYLNKTIHQIIEGGVTAVSFHKPD